MSLLTRSQTRAQSTLTEGIDTSLGSSNLSSVSSPFDKGDSLPDFDIDQLLGPPDGLSSRDLSPEPPIQPANFLTPTANKTAKEDSDSDSDTDAIALQAHILSMANAPSTLNVQYASVTHPVLKLVPILTAGDITAQVLSDWFAKCESFFSEKSVTIDKRALHAMSGL